MRVDVQLLAGLGVVQEHRPDVGQLHLAPVVQADRDDLVPAGQPLRAPAPSPGALMKSEMTNTSDRPLIQRWPASSSGARSVIGAVVERGCACRSLMSRRTWTRPPRAGIVRSTRLP